MVTMEKELRRLEYHATTSKRFRSMLYASSATEDRHVRTLAEKGDKSAIAIQEVKDDKKKKNYEVWHLIERMSKEGDELAKTLAKRRVIAHEERHTMIKQWAYRGETLTDYLSTRTEV